MQACACMSTSVSPATDDRSAPDAATFVRLGREARPGVSLSPKTSGSAPRARHPIAPHTPKQPAHSIPALQALHDARRLVPDSAAIWAASKRDWTEDGEPVCNAGVGARSSRAQRSPCVGQGTPDPDDQEGRAYEADICIPLSESIVGPQVRAASPCCESHAYWHFAPRELAGPSCSCSAANALSRLSLRTLSGGIRAAR